MVETVGVASISNDLTTVIDAIGPTENRLWQGPEGFKAPFFCPQKGNRISAGRVERTYNFASSIYPCGRTAKISGRRSEVSQPGSLIP